MSWKLNSPLDKHAVILGDNLPILENLLATLRGKIDCICIDPPYFGLRKKLSYADGVGTKSGSISRYDAFQSFMKPRLELLKELLSDQGCIWVFIDDAMLYDLRQIMNEVFGRHNFLWHIIWKKRGSGPFGVRGVSKDHDFIVCYSKKPNKWIPRNIKTITSKEKTSDDGDKRGRFYGERLWRPKKSYILPKHLYTLMQNGRLIKPPAGYAWTHPKERVEALMRDNRLLFNRTNQPLYKRFVSEHKPYAVSSLWVDQNTPINNTTRELAFLNETPAFVFPKPLKLIERILKISTHPDALILDCFAGTGTVGHAALSLNQADSGQRRFVLVEENSDHFEIICKRLTFAGALENQDYQLLDAT